MRRLPFLMIVHQKHSVTGRIGDRLAARGYPLDVRRPILGDPLPTGLDGHAGAVIFGGPMSANDDHLEGLRREIDWVGAAMEMGRPMLGICLGAQIMTRAFGGAVRPRADGRVEIGYYPIAPTGEDPAFLSGPMQVYQWHREGFDLPCGAVRLASGTDFENQAFRIDGNIYGIQFHPEVTRAMMERWLVAGAERLVLPGARSPEQHRRGNDAFDSAVSAWLDGFIDRWIGPVADDGQFTPVERASQGRVLKKEEIR